MNKLKNAAQFDLLAISGADLVAVLLDLTKFSDSSPELAETALSLLFRVSQPHAIVIDAVQKTQLLACKEFSDIFNQCGPALRSLKNQVDLAEVHSFVMQGVICLMRFHPGVDASGRSAAFRGDHLHTYVRSVYMVAMVGHGGIGPLDALFRFQLVLAHTPLPNFLLLSGGQVDHNL